jgi:hypothetical protein
VTLREMPIGCAEAPATPVHSMICATTRDNQA